MALGLPLRVSWLCFLLVSIGFCYPMPPKGSPSGIGGDNIGPSWPTQLFSRQFTGSSSAIGDDNRGSSWPNRISSRRFTGSLSAIGDDNRGSSWPTFISSRLFSNTPRESSSFSKWPHYSEAAQRSHHTLQPPSTPRDIAVTHSVYAPVVESTYYEQPEHVGFYPPVEPEPARYPRPPAEPEPAGYPRPPAEPEPARYPRPPVEPARYPRPPVEPEPARYPHPPVEPEPASLYPHPPVEPEPARYPRPPVEPARYPHPPVEPEPASLYQYEIAPVRTDYSSSPPRPTDHIHDAGDLVGTEPSLYAVNLHHLYPAASPEYSTWPSTDPEPEDGPSISGEYEIAPVRTDYSSSPPRPTDHIHDAGDLVGTEPSVYAVNPYDYLYPAPSPEYSTWPGTDPEPEDGPSISGEYEFAPARTDFSSSPPRPTDHIHDAGDLVGTEPSVYAVNLYDYLRRRAPIRR